MRHYLATLHKRSDGHRKRFSLAVSGGITLTILAFWGMTTFGTGGMFSSDGVKNEVAENKLKEVSPFESIKMSLGSSYDAFKESLTGLKGAFKNPGFQSNYDDLKEEALETYGR